MKILHIETSTKHCSVAVSDGDQILSHDSFWDEKFSHAEKLHVMIEACLKSASITPTSLHAVQVSKGPGSYTGLRIGVSAAKGICFAADLPLLEMGSLEIIAEAAKAKHPNAPYYIATIDARRMEVFARVYDHSLNPITAVEAVVVNEDTWSEYEGAVIAGDGCEKLQDTLQVHCTFETDIHPDAQFMVSHGSIVYQMGRYEDPIYFEPFYLKDFIAGKPKKLL